MIDARLLERDVVHAADDILGAVERRAIGQLREADQVLLVLRRHEAARNGLEQADGGHRQHHVDRHHHGLARDRLGDAAAVARSAAGEQAVEPLEEASEDGLHAAREAILGLIVPAQEQRGQGRRQREGVHRGDHRGDGDRQRELLVELAGQSADEGERHEHRGQHERDRDDRARDFAHRAIRGLARTQPALDVSLDVLDHHDRVVDHDADGEHEAEQRQRVDREPEHAHDGERADHRHRHGQQRDDGGAPGLQEQDDDQHDEDDRLDQRMHDGLDRRAHELGRVVDDLVLDALGHRFLQFLHLGSHAIGDRDRVGAWRREDRDGDGILVVQQGAQRVVGRTELDARDIAQARHRPTLGGLDDDVAEFLDRLQAPLGVHRKLDVDALESGRGTHDARGGLHVLLADGRDDVVGRHAMLGDPLRIQPDAHRIVARAEQLHVADALHAGEAILDVEQPVVAQVGHVVAAGRREQVHNHRQVGRALDRRQPQRAHLGGQARLGLRDAVLHQLLRLVGVGAQLEGDGQRHQAVGGRLAAHVEHAFDPVDGLLERRGDRLGDHLRIGAGVVRSHDDRRRHDVRILRHRQPAHRNQATEEDQQRQDAGEDRPVDEEFGEVHEALRYQFLRVAEVCASATLMVTT